MLLLAIASGSSAGTIVGIGAGGAIPPGAPLQSSGTFTSDAVLATAGTVASGNAVTVVLKGLQHDWSGDLIAALTYLDSQGNVIQSANLFSQIGQSSTMPMGSWVGFGAPGPTGDNYSFNTDFPGDLWAIANGLGFANSIPGLRTDTVNGGQYFTSDSGGIKNDLSYAFAGLNLAGGTWRLTIQDVSDHAAQGGTISNIGSLVGWEIDIQTSSGPAQDFAITANSATQSVAPGASLTYSISIAPLNGFPGPIDLAVNGLPVGASAAFSPGTVSLSGSPVTATLTMSLSTATAPGSYSFTISGQAGSLVHSTAASFVVTATTSPALTFVPITPCRVADTRNAAGPFGAPEMTSQTSRDFAIPQSGCSIPANAAAYALNVTVIPDAALGYLTLWPSGQPQPNVSTLNSDGRIKANAAIVPAGANGAVSVYVSDSTQVILDINGYFVPGNNLLFYPLLPCRVVDTRIGIGPLAGPYLSGGQVRTLPLPSSSCNIPNNAAAFSLNFTAIPKNTLDYLTTWPAGQPQPFVSALNAPTGAITANAGIVQAGQNENISVFATDDTDLVIDINGYFAPAATGGLSLYTLVPCRALDTRSSTTSQPFSGTLAVNAAASGCGIPASAGAYVFNATVIPPGALAYLTLWADSSTQPLVSTLNALDGAITSNLAIVPTSNGSIDAFASNPTQLILDITAYFSP